MEEIYDPRTGDREARKVRACVSNLRSKHGDQDWLTVVTGVTADAYRLAGFTGEEFGALLRAQGGVIDIGARRRPSMRLRAGFEGGNGGIRTEDGFACMFFHHAACTYSEREDSLLALYGMPCVVVSSGVGPPGTPTDLLGRLVRSIVPDLPRCLDRIRVRDVLVRPPSFQMRVTRSWETLARMPDPIAAELGVPEQRDLEQIPWLNLSAL